MIYSLDIKDFPNRDVCIEYISYMDENDFEWRIARIDVGFCVGYFGDNYFKDAAFSFDLPDGHLLLRNTGCFIILNTEFEAFYDFRNILKNAYTDDIWEAIHEMLEERLLYEKVIMDCERI